MNELLRRLAALEELVTESGLMPSIGGVAAITTMFLVFLLSDLAAAPLQVGALTGFGFAVGSAVAVGVVRKPDLLLTVTAPPAIFLVAITCAELVTAHINHSSGSVGRIAAGVFLTLSTAAPWMFGGLAGAILIAVLRGLPRSVRDLRSELAGRPVHTPRTRTPRSAWRP